jgi:predicted TIM-barrel fold metal-dependent hydrolase
LYDRLDEFGFDYVVLYPTLAFGSTGIDDEDLRLGLVRGYNNFFADVYGPYADRMTVAGLIPMHSAEEALAELDHCKKIGLKVVSIPHGVVRPIPQPVLDNGSPYLWPGQRHWLDTFGLDSDIDYDPVWQRFQDHGFAVTAHGGMTLPPNVYSSITSFTYNHMGSFVQMMYPLAKSLYLGGVTARFPQLPIAFLECGVAWACAMLHDLVEHWEKRSREGVEWTNPANIDLSQMEGLMREHAGDFPDLEDRFAELIAPLANPVTTPECLDEWVHVAVEKVTDIRDRFVDSLYFGCEADDRTTAFAFSPANAFSATLKVVLSSDIGHWDVRDMHRVLPHACSLVEEGLLTPEQFADFTFRFPMQLHTAVNPDFFEGTAVAGAVRDALGHERGREAAAPGR